MFVDVALRTPHYALRTQMNLPNYFLADLPPEATLSPAMIAEACQTLKRNREQYLRPAPRRAWCKLLCEAGGKLAGTGISVPEAGAGKRAGGHGIFPRDAERGAWTIFSSNSPRKIFTRCWRRNWATPNGWTKFAPRRSRKNTRARRWPPRRNFVVHIAAGNIPNPALMSIVLGLLTRSAQFVKCASGGSLLPRLFAHSIYDADAETGRVPGNCRMARRRTWVWKTRCLPRPIV